ncbi:hypothetical protein K402DRAFT_373900 [Aulographum hederae CBS 113979]|uniref:Uncharacterized protein n=1 Tax=Aulographum hederae CBS 113979 TaxID=1176131 RepID=A0A6G1H539_9PEZI|nr:hypothetical protein K402DRAFT_373900 [Aulographum hederae CBS 113979]
MGYTKPSSQLHTAQETQQGSRFVHPPESTNPVKQSKGSNMAGGEDYVDKALDAVEKKAGQMSGHNVDSNKMRGTNEKITDKLRAWFEKTTGKKLPSKVSN